MKRLAIYFLLSISFIACDNEIDIIEESKDIPVVYGVLSLSDTAQYVRIERAFVDPNTSALVLAQIVDSIYYQDLNVSIVNTSMDTFSLERVNGINEGFPRDEGVFVDDPNFLYKITTQDLRLNEEEEYTILIERPGELPLVTATTNIVGSFGFIRPNPLVAAARIDFDFINPTEIRWREGSNAVIYDVFLDIFVEETLDGNTEEKMVTWRLAQNSRSNSVIREGIDFYTFLRGALERNEDISRKFQGINIRVQGGNQELNEFILIGEANLGITSTQDIPVYTNLSEGRGIFGSTSTSTFEGLDITLGTQDSLENSTITRDLNFRF